LPSLFATKLELNNTGVPLKIPTEKKSNYTHRKDVLNEIEKGVMRKGKESSLVKWLISM